MTASSRLTSSDASCATASASCPTRWKAGTCPRWPTPTNWCDGSRPTAPRWSARRDRQALPSTHRGGAGLHRAVPVDLPVGEALQHLVERDAAFESSQRRPETEVDPVAERQVMVDLAVDVERVAVRELAVVAVGGTGQQHHHAPGRDN